MYFQCLHLSQNLLHLQKHSANSLLHAEYFQRPSYKLIANNKSFKNRYYALVDSHVKSDILQRLQYIMKHHVKLLSCLGLFSCGLLFIGSFTIVFEPSYKIINDENGNKIYENIEGQTYYIKNGDSYDLYMQNEYVYTTTEILEKLNNVPIYNSLEEVKQNEK